MQKDDIQEYLADLLDIADLSKSEELKVGCIFFNEDDDFVVRTNNRVIGDVPLKQEDGSDSKYWCHAEERVIGYCAKEEISTKNGTLLTTHAPCIRCARLILISGISKVIYLDEYKPVNGLEYLRKMNVKTIKYKDFIKE